MNEEEEPLLSLCIFLSYLFKVVSFEYVLLSLGLSDPFARHPLALALLLTQLPLPLLVE